MAEEERMTINERYKVLRIVQEHYRQAKRKERSQMLDHLERLTQLDRKTLIRHMNSKIERKPRRKQRGKTYGHEVDDALRVISETLDYICAERIKPSLVSMAKDLANHDELQLSADLLQKLERISTSTLRRRLKKFAHLEQGRLPRRQGPRQRNPVARSIPTKRIPWDEQEPGHFEVDLVHHCGPSPSGHYVHSLHMIDVATGWSERVAILGRSQRVMGDAFMRILFRLPFPVREIHPDNGAEFLNDHLVRLWKDKVAGVQLSRSRPFHKNDNRFVEQKNATLVRYYLGDWRLDTVAQTRLLNRIYNKMWLYYNFFQPVMRLTEKTIILTEDQGHHVRRHYGPAQTPFQRLCATNAVPDAKRQQLQRLRDQTNPRRLRQEIYDLLDQLFSLPGAEPNQTEDALETLFVPPPV